MGATDETPARERTLTLHLTEEDYAILEKFRGELSHDSFVSALLRMLDSGAVKDTPEWVKLQNPPTQGGA